MVMKHIVTVFILNYLRFCAKLALIIHKPYTIGIAGSVGKSSTRNAIYAILSEYFSTKNVTGNSETGIPLGILGFNPGNYKIIDWLKVMLVSPFRILSLLKFKYMVVEMGIDDPNPPKNMEYLLTIIKPDTAISMNVSATHTMQFEKLLPKKPNGVEDYDFLLKKIAEEDTKIINKSGCKIAIYNADDKYVFAEMEDANNSLKKIKTFGENSANTISFEKYDVNLDNVSFSFKQNNNLLSLKFDHVILPKAYREVFAAAILATEDIVGSFEKVKFALEKNYKLPPGRSSLLEGINNSFIIDSSYNASKNSVIEFISLLKELKNITKRQSVFLFGDMRELGSLAKSEHTDIASKLEGIDYLYLVGPLTKEYVLDNVSKNKFKDLQWFQDSKAAGNYLKKNLPNNSVILVKGSQNTIFLEEAIKYILKNKEDEKKLCRQNSSWLKIKKVN